MVQYGKRVWNLVGEDDSIANRAIEKTEEFFRSLGVKTRISDYTADHANAHEIISNVFIERDWLEMGERGAITPDDVKSIVKASF